MSRVKSNDDGDEDDDDVDDDDGDDDKPLRRGCCVKRLTRHMARVPFEGGGKGGGPYVRHLEAISQTKKLWINTNQKATKQTIGAKWTQLIPPASGRNRLSIKRHADEAAGPAGESQLSR